MNLKHITSILFIYLFTQTVFSQVDSLNQVAEAIKHDRDQELKNLSDNLKRNQAEVESLTKQLEQISKNNTPQKIEAMEKLQAALAIRLDYLEREPVTKITYNGQLAFTELLSLQRDIKPANLFTRSQAFFSGLGDINNLQNYPDFNNWLKEYDKWSKDEDHKDAIIALIDQSINMVKDASNNVPIYGSITQTLSSSVSVILGGIGKKGKALKEKTPAMLNLLMITGQFANQKAIIDHEWELIQKELDILQAENDRILLEQLKFYHLEYVDCKMRYLEENMETRRDRYKKECIEKMITQLEAESADKKKKDAWLQQVETYMYQVQSLRMRFGQLTYRMQANIKKYEALLDYYSDAAKFPNPDFQRKISTLNESLQAVSQSFDQSFRPAKYIEDSATMYIQRP